MDMFVSAYLDLFERQERANVMYQEIMDGINTIIHHQNVLDALNRYGYSKSLIESVGGESFTTMIHISKGELEGKDRYAKRSIYTANLITWIGNQFATLYRKFIAFLRWVWDSIVAWFHNRHIQIRDTQTSRLTSIGSFAPDFMVPHVLDYRDFINKLNSIRNLGNYLNTWFVEAATAYDKLCDVSANTYLDVRVLVGHMFSDTNKVIDTFTKETQHQHYRDGYVANRLGGSIIPPVDSEEPVSLVEFGWNGGSQIRFANSLLKATEDELRKVEGNLKSLESNVREYEAHVDEIMQNWVSSQQIGTAKTVMYTMIESTTFLLKTTQVLMGGVALYNTKYTAMVEWILQELKKKK